MVTPVENARQTLKSRITITQSRDHTLRTSNHHREILKFNQSNSRPTDSVATSTFCNITETFSV